MSDCLERAAALPSDLAAELRGVLLAIDVTQEAQSAAIRECERAVARNGEQEVIDGFAQLAKAREATRLAWIALRERADHFRPVDGPLRDAAAAAEVEHVTLNQLDDARFWQSTLQAWPTDRSGDGPSGSILIYGSRESFDERSALPGDTVLVETLNGRTRIARTRFENLRPGPPLGPIGYGPDDFEEDDED